MKKNKFHLNRLFTGSLRGLYFLLGIAAILFWTYLFGHPILEGNITGSDSGFHLSLISWIDRWFPEFPGWYPLQGAGCSSNLQYPYGAHFFVVFLSRASGLTLIRAFRLTQFASVAVTAWGIYIFSWRKLHNQTMALIAGLFYPISSAAWHWLAGIGLFAQAVSLAFFAPTFLLFDAYLLRDNDHRPPPSFRRRRLILLAASVSFGLMIITHVITAIVFAMTFLMYLLVSSFLRGNSNRLSIAIGYCGRAIAAMLPGFGLASFWMAPFLYVSALTNREGVLLEFNQIRNLDLISVIGLKPAPPTSIWGPTIFASPVLIMAAVGFLLSLKRRDVVLSLAIITVTFAILTAVPNIFIVNVLKSVWAKINLRGIIPTMIFLPVMAGYGATGLSQQIVNLPYLLLRNRKVGESGSEQRLVPGSILKSGLAGLLGIVIAICAFLYLRHSPPGYGSYQGYGLPRGDAWWPFNFENGRVMINHWPTFTMSSEDWPNGGITASELVKNLELDASERLDLSPNLGGLLEVLPLYTDASTVGIYYYVSSLIRPMKGYQVGTYYIEDKGSPHEVNEFARWFGIEYVILDKEVDPIKKYEIGNWQSFPLPDKKHFDRLGIYRFNESTGLASILTRPKILVIGGYENGIYDSIFRLFNSGVVEYQEATIVEGSHRIDDYPLEELSQFELIFLRGYGYGDRDRAWNLLAEYVQGGGSLYIDTGWQYWVPEWEMDEAPAVLPVGNLEWKEVAPTDQLVLASNMDWLNVDAQLFAPMIWGGDQPWGVSSPSNGLRDWATPVLEASGKPIVVIGHYGDGKVVWSGMNLVGHIRKYGNSEEMGFIRSLIQWLLPESKSDHVGRLEVQRDHPDRITLRIPGPIDKGTFLLWREAHAPGWHASVKVNDVDKDVKIYRAGPGMMLMNLPFSQDDEVVVTMEYSLDLVRGVGQAFTILTGILLLGLVAGIFGASRSDTGQITGALERDPHHRLTASDRDIGIHTRRSSMWKRLFSWLPKPFLDEETHYEEANQESREYLEPGSTDEGTDSETIQEIQNESIFEVELSNDEEILFKAWLDNTNHTDDSWIRKTLGKGHQGNKQ